MECAFSARRCCLPDWNNGQDLSVCRAIFIFSRRDQFRSTTDCSRMADVAFHSAPPPPAERLSFRVSLQRIYLFATIAAFKLLMDYSYVHFLSPENAVENNFTNNFNPEKGIESWGLTLICAAFLPLTTRKPSDFLLHVFFIFPVIATLSFYAFLDGDRLFAYGTTLIFIVVAITRNLKLTLPYWEVKNGYRLAVPISILTVLFIALAYYVILGTGTFQLDIMDVYSVRLQITERLNESLLLGYGGTWTWRVVTPFLMAWAILKRRWLLLLLTLAAQVYFFGVTSAKVTLFFPGLIFVTYVFARPKLPLVWMFVPMILFVLAGILEQVLVGTFLWNHVLVRRVLWMAARLNWSYYELFSEIGHVYMSMNFFKILIPYPFPLDPAHMVGLLTLGSAEANADTGFIGTSYMHFGFIGMVTFAFITGLLLRLTDMLTLNRMPVWIGVAGVIGAFWALFNDSDLPTTMLTHGLAPALLLLFLYGHFPKEKIRALFRARRAGKAPS